MLSLLMLLLAEQPVVRPAPLDDAPRVRMIPDIDAAPGCENGLTEANVAPPRAAGPSSLLDRGRDAGQARRYLLLDRRDQNGCPLPISFAIPDQPRALGRELGPAPSWSAPTTPRF